MSAFPPASRSTQPLTIILLSMSPYDCPPDIRISCHLPSPYSPFQIEFSNPRAIPPAPLNPNTLLRVLYLCYVPLFFLLPLFLFLESLWLFSFQFMPRPLTPGRQLVWEGSLTPATPSWFLTIPHDSTHTGSHLQDDPQGPTSAFYTPAGSLVQLQWWQTHPAGAR